VLTTNVGSTTTYFVGNHYEVTNGVVTKYYYAGTQRIAIRENGVLSYIIGDHLGSTSIITDASGAVISETKYKAWGETRYSSGTNPTDYTYTGQYSYTDDFGLMFYNARWYDSSLGRFAQADTIVPSGVQGLDRYAYVNNSPLNYVDPTGHFSEDEIEKYLRQNYGKNWKKYWDAWQSDDLFWGMLLDAEIGDDLHAPTTLLDEGEFVSCENSSFCFESESGNDLYEYQGQGPYILERNGLPVHTSKFTSPFDYKGNKVYSPFTGGVPIWSQPQYDYSQGYPVATGQFRVVTYNSPVHSPTLSYPSTTTAGAIIFGTVIQFATKIPPIVGQISWAIGALSYLNEGPGRFEWSLTVDYVQPHYIPPLPNPFNPFETP